MYPVIVTILFLIMSARRTRGMFSINPFLTISLLLVFFLGILEQFKFELFYINIVVEGLILFLLVTTIYIIRRKGQIFRTPSLNIFTLFTLVLIISVINNSSDLYQSYLYYRFFLTPFLLMLVIVNIPLSEIKIGKLVEFIEYLFVFQLIATIVKLLILGYPEHPVGTIIVQEVGLQRIFL